MKYLLILLLLAAMAMAHNPNDPNNPCKPGCLVNHHPDGNWNHPTSDSTRWKHEPPLYMELSIHGGDTVKADEGYDDLVYFGTDINTNLAVFKVLYIKSPFPYFAEYRIEDIISIMFNGVWYRSSIDLRMAREKARAK